VILVTKRENQIGVSEAITLLVMKPEMLTGWADAGRGAGAGWFEWWVEEQAVRIRERPSRSGQGD
jgi:hypothetical protein